MNGAIFHTAQSIILASASPRRQTFLKDLGLEFTVIPASIDETPLPLESAEDFVQRMATCKAKFVARDHPQDFVIGADTIISFQGEILGKPKDAPDALRILQTLQGATHQVMTALSLCSISENLSTTIINATSVTFEKFPEEILTAYIQSGEPMDKAGAYAIQGQGGFLVKEIKGACSTVIGLPMNDLVALLLRHKIIIPTPAAK